MTLEFLGLIIYVFIGHWIADFIMQTNKQAVEKSSNFRSLLDHTVDYAGAMTLVISFYEIFVKQEITHNWMIFGIVTFITHTITDYFTSKVNKKLAPKEYTIRLKDSDKSENNYVCFPEGRDYHNFFVGVGFDQTVHYITLLLTLYFLYA